MQVESDELILLLAAIILSFAVKLVIMSVAVAAIIPKKKWTPSPRSVEEVTQLLQPEKGCRLNELKLCWREPRTKNESVGLLTKRNVASLERALKKTPSRITRVSVGWKHGGDRKSLIKLLQVFINEAHAPPLQPVDSIELVLAAWVPDSVLVQMLLTYASRLESLHIQATRMKVRTTKPNPLRFKNAYQSVHAVDYVLEEESVAKLFGNPKLANALTGLTSLSLVDCDVLDEEVDILVNYLWQRARASAVETLSLRSNRHMSPSALQKLAQAPVSHSLDLSLCDITNSGASALARAFASENRIGWRQRNSVVLKELTISGNYQIDERGFTALYSVVPYQVQHWNMSYCDITENQSLVILEELTTPLSLPTIPLQELTLQGLKMHSPAACQVIQSILRGNRSLTKICISDPKYPTPISVPNLQIIAEGLRYHYGLQELELDMRPLKVEELLSKEMEGDEVRQVHDAFQFYLLLNRAGRKMLQNSDQFDKNAWIQALFKARLSGRLDVLYWLLSNSVVYLF